MIQYLFILLKIQSKKKRENLGEWYLEEVDKVYGNKDMEDLIDK